jgi:hypothetical protein
MSEAQVGVKIARTSTMAPATERQGRADDRPARPPRCGERVRPRWALEAADGARGGEYGARAWRPRRLGARRRAERRCEREGGGGGGVAAAASLQIEEDTEMKGGSRAGMTRRLGFSAPGC